MCARCARHSRDGGARRRRGRGPEARDGGGGMNDWLGQIQGYSNQYFGPEWGPTVYSTGRTLAMIVMVLAPVVIMVLYYQLIERWVIGWMQVRKGPNRVGYKGILQPIAD